MNARVKYVKLYANKRVQVVYIYYNYIFGSIFTLVILLQIFFLLVQFFLFFFIYISSLPPLLFKNKPAIQGLCAWIFLKDI